jgi:UDPglucose 6-dehydrogenase
VHITTYDAHVTVFGAGYVGLVTSGCLANYGYQVLCVDSNAKKIELLNQGGCPIYEPGLPELLQRNVQSGRLKFSNDAQQGVTHGFYLFITVGTPQNEDGSANIRDVLSVAHDIACFIDQAKLIVIKSTVPVGTGRTIYHIIQKELTQRRRMIPFQVASNPEFLKQGAAVSDFMHSDRIIIGTQDDDSSAALKALYHPFNRNKDRLIVMDIQSAELTKYAANAFLATKISFMNEMSHLAELFNADIEMIRIGIGSDPRIGYQFMYPGCGYGGSCFPKDVYALETMAKSVNYDAQLLTAVRQVNERQKQVLFHKLKRYFGDLKQKKIAIWGLSFKPNTSDMRQAPSQVLIKALLDTGAQVSVYDPVATQEAKKIFGTTIHYNDDPYHALQDADALTILTEWSEFFNPDFQAIKQTLKQPVIFDGRNLYDPDYLKSLGFHYDAIGRGDS